MTFINIYIHKRLWKHKASKSEGIIDDVIFEVKEGDDKESIFKVQTKQTVESNNNSGGQYYENILRGINYLYLHVTSVHYKRECTAENAYAKKLLCYV